MCSLFYLDAALLQNLEVWVPEIDDTAEKVCLGRDIHPTERAFILREGEGGLCISGVRWGYPNFLRQGVVINARAETVWEKKMFSNGIHYHRAVIPATLFYEWNQKKEKNRFTRRDGSILYMAGFFDMIDNEERFVIVTVQANHSMKEIHDRMPLVLEKEQIEDWIRNEEDAESILRQVPVELKREADYEQLTLF